MDIEESARLAQEAGFDLALLATARKNQILLEIADSLERARPDVYKANELDIKAALERSLPPALVDRLRLNDKRFNEIVKGVRDVAALEDPVGRIYDGHTVESGLKIVKRSVPFGVVGVIYEARPNVTVDIAALCLKSGNACILRGGREALNSNRALYRVMAAVLNKNGIKPGAVTFIDDPDRALVGRLLKLDQYVDVIIPRGGEALHRLCQRESTIPVIVGGFGISHVFVDSSAELERCVAPIVNAKVQKPSACNALDTLLVHEAVAGKFLPMLLPELALREVKIHAHGAAAAWCEEYPYLEPCSEEDFDEEWLSLRLNIALVKNVREAIAHLRAHKASHSDAIFTNFYAKAQLFSRSVGSACVYINASTRFTDGGQFGMGAEVAISTQKLHVRGPMGLKELTTYQYVCEGDYLART